MIPLPVLVQLYLKVSLTVFQAHNYLTSGLITEKQFDKTWTNLSFMTSDLILKTGEIATSRGA